MAIRQTLAGLICTIAASAAVAPALAGSVMNGAPAAKPAAAGSFVYQGYAGGFKVGEVAMDLALRDGRYAAKMRLETAGMVGWFVEWRHGTSVHGAASPDQGPAPHGAPLTVERYHADSYWKKKDRFVNFEVREGGVAEVTKAAPHPVKDEERPLITAAQRTDVLDPLTAIIAVGRTLEQTGSCKASYPVYDGRRRYTLKIEDQGIAELEPSRRTPYEGNAQRCKFVFERVAGFRKEIAADDEPTNGRAYYRRPAPGAPMMPVKIIAELELGSAIINLKQYKALDPAKAEQTLLQQPTKP
ncbi:MAG: DUF3108 domain-containing protein [Alphaproteobacteria bacterium]|jgi:hypothetical protein|nr:DUF3108 domain-containing protein [Alphaproteobacteria bacterium]